MMWGLGQFKLWYTEYTVENNNWMCVFQPPTLLYGLAAHSLTSKISREIHSKEMMFR